MNSTTTSKIASSKKDEKKDGFKGKDILPPDKITVEDIQRALHDECDFAAQPLNYENHRPFVVEHDYNYSIF